MLPIYALAGFLSLRLGVVLWNFFGNTHLTPSFEGNSDEMVSILIPVKNEERNIRSLLESIRRQDYSNVEVLILNDQSSDGTVTIVQQYCASHAHFRLIEGQDLPSGWLGKSFACAQLSELASGTYLLFLDADVTIHRGLIRGALKRFNQYKLSLLSLFADQQMRSSGEWLTVPLMNYFLLSFLPLPLVRLSPRGSLSAANGQFMLFDRREYLRHQWHSHVRGRVAEDYEICKSIKAKGLLAETLLSAGLVRCRMYTGLKEAIEGFTKNTFALFNYKYLGIILFLVMIFGLDFWVFAHAPVSFTIVFILCIGLMKYLVARMSRQNAWVNLLVHPLHILMMVYITVSSVIRYRMGNVFWKGRRIDFQQLDPLDFHAHLDDLEEFHAKRR